MNEYSYTIDGNAHTYRRRNVHNEEGHKLKLHCLKQKPARARESARGMYLLPIVAGGGMALIGLAAMVLAVFGFGFARD